MSAEAMGDLVRAAIALGANCKVRHQPEFPVRNRIYEEDSWSESSDNKDDPEWLSILTQLPPWIRDPGGGNGVSEENGMSRRLPALSSLAIGAPQRALGGAT